jgi:hypothetical protein
VRGVVGREGGGGQRVDGGWKSTLTTSHHHGMCTGGGDVNTCTSSREREAGRRGPPCAPVVVRVRLCDPMGVSQTQGLVFHLECGTRTGSWGGVEVALSQGRAMWDEGGGGSVHGVGVGEVLAPSINKDAHRPTPERVTAPRHIQHRPQSCARGRRGCRRSFARRCCTQGACGSTRARGLAMGNGAPHVHTSDAVAHPHLHTPANRRMRHARPSPAKNRSTSYLYSRSSMAACSLALSPVGFPSGSQLPGS